MWRLQGELVDGEPLFPGESDIDQLYRIQQMLGPIIVEHRMLFEMHPAHNSISFPIIKPITLARRYNGRLGNLDLDFLNGLLHLDPKKRLSGSTCLRHAYLRDMTAADADMRHVLDEKAA
jgi:cyclin-dependent kinase-like